MISSSDERRKLEGLDRDALQELQLEKLNRLLAEIIPANRFYAGKFQGISLPLASLDDLKKLPFTTKEEIQVAANDDLLVANHTYPRDRYVRFHQTSGTRGEPMVVLDTAEDWRWWVDCWQFVLDAAGVTASDRAVLAFSFGPFIGFWSAFEALAARGALTIPAGGMHTHGRVELIRRTEATTLFCTPTYALHLAEVAEEQGINLARMSVERIIVAGEPGGSVPAVRQRIEEAWGARVCDHCGATEVGPWGYGDTQQRGVHILESEFIAEFISLETGQAAREGELSHLVLTTLGRTGCPVIRYRTGDLVRPYWSTGGKNRFVLLEGGVIARTDDMMVIRGVNVYPTSIEQILRSFPEVVEYRMTVRKKGALDEMIIEVEDRLMQPERIAKDLEVKLGLRIDVRCVSALSLPRFEGKGRRFVDER
jgi:phenylacetate-CoA ligase